MIKYHHQNILTAATVLSLTFMPSPSMAAIDESGAQNLKIIIGNYLEEQKTIYQASGTMMELIGDMTVTPKGNYYNIILPHIKTTYVGDTVLNIGKIVINAAPGDKAEDWKISYSLPKDITITQANGSVQNITFANQSAAGIWNTKLNYITALKAHYKDIKISAPSGDEGITSLGSIGSIKIEQDLKDSGQNLWSGPISMNAETIEFHDEFGKKISLDKASIGYTINNINPKGYEAIRNHVYEIGKNNTSISTLDQQPEELGNLVQTLTKLFEEPMGEMTSDFAINNLKLTERDKQTEILTVASANFGLDIDMSNPEQAAFGLRIKASDIVQNIDPSQKNFSPKNIDLDLKIKNFPMQDIMKNARNELDKNIVVPSTPMITLLSQAQTTVENKASLETEALSISGKGTILATLANPLGMNADQKWEITGLDAFMKEINTQMGDNPFAGQMLGPLVILQMAGQIAPDNPDKRTYHILANENGVTVNGSDISQFMSGATAAMGSR
ncbi:MAG TPA: hypothetical protein PLK94_02510 [Alphaproteobacteria bacterium]|nr:hypothetical protein [Alphaproteobacteria bacterium]HOO50140.1 hypothetical protein [Alphaproteobacteria bacterium]